MAVRIVAERRDRSSPDGKPTEADDGKGLPNEGLGSEAMLAAALASAGVGEEDLLEWDVWLVAPARPERTFQARFEYAGRDRPIPLDGPEAEPEQEA